MHKIYEIFYSLQGEGQFIGNPTIFVRLSGCNLRCSWCDTQYAYEEGKKMSVNDIVKKIQEFPCKVICLTGGEPLLQNCEELISKLSNSGYTIVIETNGTMDIQKYQKYKGVVISMDVKPPSSNTPQFDNCSKTNWGNLSALREIDQLKIIVDDKQDYSFAINVLNMHKPKSIIFFNPKGGINGKKLAKWLLKDRLPNVRLGIQLHKLLWGNRRGV